MDIVYQRQAMSITAPACIRIVGPGVEGEIQWFDLIVREERPKEATAMQLKKLGLGSEWYVWYGIQHLIRAIIV